MEEKKKRTIVVKVGTNVLTANGTKLDKKIIAQVVKQLAALHRQGWGVVFVTSGAVATGRQEVSLPAISDQVDKRQVWAAIGQPMLMNLYRQLFSQEKIAISQALLIRDDFADQMRYQNILKALTNLLESRIIPIANENDVVKTYQTTFGDNDGLAANIAIALQADPLVILTNTDGLYDSDPAINKKAKLITEVIDVNRQLLSMVSKKTSSLGLGGMLSKINAAQLATSAGVTTYIANGFDQQILQKIITGQSIGTKFLAKKSKLTNRARRFLSGKTMGSKIIIDDGAVKALQQSKSLLLVGVKKIIGQFESKEVVAVYNQQDDLIGYGLVRFSSTELQQGLMAPKKFKSEVIHTDNLFILKDE